MNHDITHCNGKNCPLRNKCLRYLAFVELKKNEIPGVFPFFGKSPYSSVNQDCDEKFISQ